MPFMTLNVILFRKKITYFSTSLFLSACYLVLLMNSYVLNYSCLKKAQSNVFLVPKIGLTVLTAFSGKFQLKFCLFFDVLFSRFKK